MKKKIILFDGDCHFCNRSVQFIIKRDPDIVFSFASLQSDIGQTLLKHHKLPSDTDSIVLIDNESYFTQSSAILKITLHLHHLYPLLYTAIFIPRPIRDYIYRFVATHRYDWFGKTNACSLPSKQDQSRFLN